MSGFSLLSVLIGKSRHNCSLCYLNVRTEMQLKLVNDERYNPASRERTATKYPDGVSLRQMQ